MDDLDDVLEAVFDLEDIVEEIFDPDDLLEDYHHRPSTVLFALGVAMTAVFTLLSVLLGGIFVLLAFGPLAVVGFLAVLSFIGMLVGFGGFLYVRTDASWRTQEEIDDALDRADDEPHGDEELSEQEAVRELQDRYSRGELDDEELEEALEDALTSEDPDRVLEEHA